MSCIPQPIAMNVGNVSLSNGAVMRGVDIAVGTPPQHLAFALKWPTNNSYLYDTVGPCEGYETAVCMTYHGGLYDESASSSSQKQASVAAAGGASDTTSGTEPDWMTDILELSANFSEPSFPLGLVRQEPGTAGGPLLNQLGLGPNSTILNALKDFGKIASRSWSFYNGRTGATADQQANGTFVLGGFDASKVPANGKNYTKQLTSSSEQCGTGMQLTLSNIQMQYPNGSSYSLYGDVESTSLKACLGSGPLAMYLPYDNFVEFTDICDCYTQNRSFGIHYYGMLYESPEPVTSAGLVVSLDGEIDITIDNSQLFTPDINIGPDGQVWANYTTQELNIWSLQQVNGDQAAGLGDIFLSSAMVMVNLDANGFTIWQAAEDTGSPQQLVAVDESNKQINTFCAATTSSASASSSAASATGSVAASTASSAAASTHTSHPPTLSGGAIAGIAIAAVALLLAVAAGTFFFIRRQKRSRAVPTATQPYRSDVERKRNDDHLPAYQQSSNLDMPDKPSTPPRLQLHEVDSFRLPSELGSGRY